MSFAETLCIVLAAVYGLASLLLSVLVAGAWHAGFGRRCTTSGQLFMLRLLPSGGAVFLTLAIALPAFLIYEPAHHVEQVGPWLVVLVMFALVTAGHGMVRMWRACAAVRRLFQRLGQPDLIAVAGGHRVVEVVDIPEPIVAVVGGWRPRIVAARCVVAACSHDEFRQVIAHEVAHLSSHDNLKLLFLVGSPDALAWLPAGAALVTAWRTAAEFEADERAAGIDPHERVSLASALIKVAKLSISSYREFATLGMPIASDDVNGRVRQLLAPPLTLPRSSHIKPLLAFAFLAPAIAVPLYELFQRFVEALVALGR